MTEENGDAALLQVRRAIDGLDDRLIALLAERQGLIDRATEIKAGAGISATTHARIAAMIASVRARAEAAGLEADIAEAIWRSMIAGFISREERTIGTGGRQA